MDAKTHRSALKNNQREIVNPRLWGRARMLRKRYFGKIIYRLGVVNSTQDALRQYFLNGAPEGAIVLAEDQIRGRGRRERPWHSLSGKGLCMSVLLLPEGPEERWTWVPLWAGIVVRKAVLDLLHSAAESSAPRIQLKWPNDILLGDRKLGGILAERVQDDRGRPGVILGIGINLLQIKEDFPPHLRAPATSLFLATGEAYLPDALLEKMIVNLEEHYPLIKPVNAAHIKKRWLEQGWGFKARLRVTCADGVLEGTFSDLGRNGELCLQVDEGRMIRLASSEKIERVNNP